MDNREVKQGEFSPSDIVAMVNGEPVMRQDFEAKVEQTKLAYEAQGADMSDEETLRAIEEQVLEGLIGEILLLQQARNSDIEVPAEDLAGGYEQVRSEFDGDDMALMDALFAQGMTREDLEREIEDRIRLQLYLEQAIDPAEISVSEDDIRNAYTNYTSEIETPPALDEVHDDLKEQLEEQRLQQAVVVLIDTLRGEGDIEVFLA